MPTRDISGSQMPTPTDPLTPRSRATSMTNTTRPPQKQFPCIKSMSNDPKLEREKQELLANAPTFKELMDGMNRLYETNSYYPVVPELKLDENADKEE